MLPNWLERRKRGTMGLARAAVGEISEKAAEI